MAIPRTHTELEDYLVYGCDFKERVIHFGLPLDWGELENFNNTEVEQASVELTVRAIHRMELEHPRKPITLYMHSAGGDVASMQYLVDVIEASTCKFKFFGGGTIGSAATWVMAVCDERNLFTGTKLLIHDGDSGLHTKSRSTTDENIEVAENNRLQKDLEKLYAENSRMPESFWRRISKRNLYIYAEEAITLGLADRIVKPKKRGTFRQLREKGLAKQIDTRKMKRLVKSLYERIHIDVKLADIQINQPQPEPIDETLVVDNSPVELEATTDREE